MLNPIEQILFTCGLLCVTFGIAIDDPAGRVIGIRQAEVNRGATR